MERISDDLDLVMEVLARLPVRSIICFRCVSKAWNKLISDDCNRKHLPPVMTGFLNSEIFNSSDSGITFVRIRNKCCYNNSSDAAASSDPNFDFMASNTGSLNLWTTCNGLVLCSFELFSDYAVCNPATRRWESLPDPPHIPGYIIVWREIGFDPCRSHHYKVLACYIDQYPSLDNDNDTYKFKMFISETRSWVDCPFCCDVYHFFVFAGGAFYAFNGDVVRIDLQDCRIIEMPPDAPRGQLDSYRIGVLDGLLHLGGEFEDEKKLWALEDNNRWVLKHVLHFQGIGEKLKRGAGVVLQLEAGVDERQDRALLRELELIRFHPNMNVIFFSFRGTILSYHLGTNSFEAIFYQGHRCDYVLLAYSPCYSHSF